MTVFDQAFEITIGHEKGFQKDPFDNGNWTGGKRGSGVLKGTKYGISAAAYPDEDIENLTIERAKSLYERDYWFKNSLDKINDAEIAMEMFDTGVNAGIGKAAKIFQMALNYTNRVQRDYPNIKVDGDIGPGTLAAYAKNRDKRILFNVMNILQGSHYLGLMDSNEGYEKYTGWFDRIQIKKRTTF